jgi:hypothetical protein
MTSAKPNHRAARALWLQFLDTHPGKTVNNDLDPLEAGIVGDTAHAEGGDSYHLGKDKIRARAGRNRYSVDESSRDQSGLDDNASAMDIGYFAITTSRGTFDLYDYNTWLINLCRAGDPDTRDLREVIYSPDGRTVRRWDALGLRTTGDSSHLTHTHHSEFRDADGHRMVNLATRWLQHIGLIAEEDDVSAQDVIAALKSAEGQAALTTWVSSANGRKALLEAILNTDGVLPAPGSPAPGKNPDGTEVNTHWGLGSYIRDTHAKATSVQAAVTGQGRVLADFNTREAAEVPPTAGQNAQAVMAALSAGTAEETAAALKVVLGDRADEVGRLLAQ